MIIVLWFLKISFNAPTQNLQNNQVGSVQDNFDKNLVDHREIGFIVSYKSFEEPKMKYKTKLKIINNYISITYDI